MRKHYSPGYTFTKDSYKFVAVEDEGNGCMLCVGRGGDHSICDMLPRGCGEDSVAWQPANDEALALVIANKLEGV
jgi:hypothetical protein